jgi:hypothetical protein
MKTLALKTVTVTNPSSGQAISQDYKVLLKACVNQVPEKGLLPEAMRERLKLLDLIAEAGETLELEDADAAKLKELVSSMPWAFADKELLAFTDAVKAL